MAFNTYCISGKWAIHLSFDSESSYAEWGQGVMEIKRRIAEINDDGNPGAARVPFYNQWLQSVEDFIRIWGENHVPPDIKSAVNTVQEGVGVQQTVWQDPPGNHLV